MSVKAARYATYNGDCTHIIGEVKGPNELCEVLTAVSAKYDLATDRTRVGFAYGVHPEVRTIEETQNHGN